MKVLFLAHSFPRFATDPVGSFVLRLAVALRERGVDVRVLAPSAPELAACEELEGIRVERFRYAPRRLETLAYGGTMRAQVRESWGGRIALLGLLAAEWLRMRRLRRTFRPDLIHAHWWFPAGLVAAVGNATGGPPVVTTMHGSDVRIAQASPAARRPFRFVMRRSAVVTVVSRWLGAATTQIVPDVSPQVVPMPVMPELFAPGGRRERDRLLFVGKLNEQKGIAHLLRALATMRHRPLVDIVVGVGSSEVETRRLAAELGVDGQLIWHPLLEQAALADRYRAATALVVPSIDEGLGLVAVEAQLCGAPVVAFASGGLTDIIVDGRTGLLVPPGDPAALAAALDTLLDLPDQGASWGREGRTHALATFSPEAAAERYLQLYEVATRSAHA